jgi:hypothetical protein
VVPGPWQRPRRTSNKAVASLVFGLFGFFCCTGALTGIPAIVLGLMARREIQRSEGAVDGMGVAIAGVVTGALSTGGMLVYLIMNVAGIWMASKAITPPPLPPPTVAPPMVTAPAAPLLPSTGSVHVISLKKSGGRLATQLLREQGTSRRAGKRLLLMTTANDCTACTEILRTFADPRVESVLADVDVALVDVDDFKTELLSLGMDKGANLPWFFLLDVYGTRVANELSADAWGENTPENVGPALHRFLMTAPPPPKGAPSGKAPPPPVFDEP